MENGGITPRILNLYSRRTIMLGLTYRPLYPWGKRSQYPLVGQYIPFVPGSAELNATPDGNPRTDSAVAAIGDFMSIFCGSSCHNLAPSNLNRTPQYSLRIPTAQRLSFLGLFFSCLSPRTNSKIIPSNTSRRLPPATPSD
jgi:hypothetical protein